jgi:uracil-DNA glycosylase
MLVECAKKKSNRIKPVLEAIPEARFAIVGDVPIGKR